MSKNDFYNSLPEGYRELEEHTADEKKELENHILGESFDIDGLNIDKITRQATELENLSKD